MTRTTPAAAAALPPAQLPAGRTRSLATLRTVAALMLREMSTRYGRTPGGYIWAILEPLAAILFLAIGFSLVIRTPSLGTSFLLFYATGYLPFSLYRELSQTVSRALSYSRPLLRYPAVTWADAVLARFLLNSLTGILITILLTGGILLAVDSRTALDLPAAVAAMGLAMALGLGVGALNCVLSGLFPLWEVAWTVLNRPLLLGSAVLYIFEDLPPAAQDIMWYNPLIHVTGLMRTSFYPTYNAAYANWAYVLVVSLILMAFGFLLLSRFHRDILNR